MKVRKAVIPAAGLGTRFLPASKVVPKELFPIVEKPLLQLNVEEAMAAGIEEIILVVSPRKEQLGRYFEPAPDIEQAIQGKDDLLTRLKSSTPNISIRTVVQQEPLGLGHAILMARELIDDDFFAVLLPDVCFPGQERCLQRLVAEVGSSGKACIAVAPVPAQDVYRYGIVGLKEVAGEVSPIDVLVEKPRLEVAPSNLSIIGRYILPVEIFTELASQDAGAVGEIQLTDAMQAIAAQGNLLAYEFDGPYYDAGDRLGFVIANVAYALQQEDLAADLRKSLERILS